MNFDFCFISNIRFDNLSLEDLIDYLKNELRINNKKIRLSLINPEFIIESKKNPSLLKYLNSCNLNLADGIGVVIASRLLFQKPLKERVTGTDFLPQLMEMITKNGFTIYYLGGKPTIAEKAKLYFENKLGTDAIVGTHHGFFKEKNEKYLIDDINKASPDILMVCLGNPKQEEWIERNHSKLNAKVVFGNGGALDFWAHEVKRAPLWMQKNGLEWFYRLIQDFTYTRIKRQLRLSKFPYLILKQLFNQGLKRK